MTLRINRARPARSYLRVTPIPAFLLLATILFFHRLTLQGEVLFWGMPLLQFFPWRTFAVEEYLAGRVPLWNPYAGMGSPLAANLQSGVFYPLNFFYLFLPIERAMTVTLVLHVFLAGWFTHLYVRRLGLPAGAALISGCTFMFSGLVVAQGGFHNVVSTIAWLPGVFLCIEAWVQSRSRLWAAAVSLSVAMTLLAGFIQTAYYGLILAAAYVPFRLWTGGREPHRGLPEALEGPPVGRQPTAYRRLPTAYRRLPTAYRLLPTAYVLMALGVALAAVQLLPTYELSKESVRQSGLEYGDSTGYSLFPGQLVTVFAPTFFGSQPGGDWWGPGAPWEGVIYAGAFPVLLGLLAAVSVIAKRLGANNAPLILFFFVVVVAALFLATGRYNPAFPFLFEHVPGLSLFHAPSRFILWYVFAVAVLAGFGWTVLAQGPPGTGRKLGRLTAAGALAVLLLALTVNSLLPDIPLAGTATSALAVGALWLLSGGLFIALLAGPGPVGQVSNLSEQDTILLHRVFGRTFAPRHHPHVWTAAAVALILADLLFHGRDLNPTTDPHLYSRDLAPTAVDHSAQASLTRTFTTDAAYEAVVNRLFEFSRFHTTDGQALAEMRRLITPNLGTVEHLQEVHNYDPLKLRRATRLRLASESQGASAPLIGMTGATALIDVSVDAGGRQVAVAVRDPQTVLPRAHLVTRVTPVRTQDDAFRFITSTGFDPRREAVVETPGADSEPITLSTTGPRAAAIVEYETQRVLVETDGEGGLLVLFDSYYPGWKAHVDGRERPILPANAAFRGVFLSPGDQHVEFRYEPQSVRAGALITALAILTVAVVAVPVVRTRKSEPREPVLERSEG